MKRDQFLLEILKKYDPCDIEFKYNFIFEYYKSYKWSMEYNIPLSAETLPPSHPFLRIISNSNRTSNSDEANVEATNMTRCFFLFSTGGLKSAQEEDLQQ